MLYCWKNVAVGFDLTFFSRRCILPQMKRLVTDAYINYTESFVASTSDFWWHDVWKTQFAASIANFISPGYFLVNGAFLVMSSLTLTKLRGNRATSSLLAPQDPKPHRLQALIDFQHWTMEKSVNRIGTWLHVIHELAGIKAAYIGSHTVDGTGNAGLSVKTLQWRTEAIAANPLLRNPVTSTGFLRRRSRGLAHRSTRNA